LSYLPSTAVWCLCFNRVVLLWPWSTQFRYGFYIDTNFVICQRIKSFVDYSMCWQ
jgi:hypothetical protein